MTTDLHSSDFSSREEALLRRGAARALPAAPGDDVVEQRLAALKAASPHLAVTGGRMVPRKPLHRHILPLVLAAVACLTLWVGVREYQSRTDAASTPVQEYATVRGERTTITLSDGTTVILAPSTTIRVHLSASTGRSVELSGAALFTVAHDPARQFVVRAGTATTTVLGTTFGVRKYPEDSVAAIAVREGRVSVNTLLLAAGEAGTVDLTGSVAKTRPADLDDLLGWTDGRLVFRNARFADVAIAMERWYGMRIVITDQALAHRRVSTVLQGSTLTLDRLAVLASSVEARVTQADGIITITPQ